MKQNTCKQQTLPGARRAMIACLIAVVLFTSISFIYFKPVNKLYAETLEEELEKVKKQKENTQKQIEQAKNDETAYISQVNQVEDKLISALKELEDLSLKLSEAKTEVDRLTIELVIKEKELSSAEKELKDKTSILNERIALIYKNKNQDLLELLFESRSFLELFSKLKLMNMIAQQDIKTLNEVKNTRDLNLITKEHIESLKEEQKQNKDKIEIILEDSVKKKREVEEIYNEKKSLLTRTRANKETLIKIEKELASKEKEITKKLEALRHGNAPGKLLYPAKGILTSGFGYRISPISGLKAFHGGIDIGAATGTQVMAAADGEVLQAEYMGGYGYSILIYHGGGFATFYAHLNGFAVSRGSKVKRGQVIGFMGSTGYSTGPHLHFEVRVNGVQKNPYSYF
ncbi:MAG: peptidoglycan DD-metalloendopeptidase family protein [Actinobacteria bacterium]|nr:peptidoglycan DD-metalloendopeptidase family protein [Actinomycetota bacterium]